MAVVDASRQREPVVSNEKGSCAIPSLCHANSTATTTPTDVRTKQEISDLSIVLDRKELTQPSKHRSTKLLYMLLVEAHNKKGNSSKHIVCEENVLQAHPVVLEYFHGNNHLCIYVLTSNCLSIASVPDAS
jgi:hypothetical protein